MTYAELTSLRETTCISLLKEIVTDYAFVTFRHSTGRSANESAGMPDFTAEICGRKVGFEITQIFADTDRVGKGVSQVYSEGVWSSIIAKAESLYRKMGGKPVKVTVDLQTGKYTADDYRKLPKLLADIVLQNYQGEDGSVDLAWEDIAHFQLSQGTKQQPSVLPTSESLRQYASLDTPINRVSIFGLEAQAVSIWTPTLGGWIRENIVQVVQEAIQQKEAKLPTYKRFVDQCELIVFVERNRPAGFLEPNFVSLNHIYTTSFQAVYFCDLFGRKLFRLNTKHPKCSLSLWRKQMVSRLQKYINHA